MPSPVTEHYVETIANDGFAIVSSCLDAQHVATLRKSIKQAVSHAHSEETVRSRGDVYAIRNLADVVPAVRKLQNHASIRELVEPVLGSHAFMVRASLFTKSIAANWGVFWHQDLSIAVRRRAQVDGYGPWTRKAGVECVQPPVHIMQSMLAVRIHLDDCRAENGPLQVIPGSHREARLSDHQTQILTSAGKPVSCLAPAGGAVVMHPLILHSSSKATGPGERRVIHLEFAGIDLPNPLEWYECCSTQSAT